MKKILIAKAIIYTFYFIIIAWFFVSYCDVLKYQDCGGTQNWWNLFNIMLGIKVK